MSRSSWCIESHTTPHPASDVFLKALCATMSISVSGEREGAVLV